MDIIVHLQHGIAIVGLAVVLTILKDQFIDVGDSYVKVLGSFRNKPVAVAVLVGSILFTALVSGYLQDWLVAQLQRPGMFEFGLGGVVLASYHYVHYQVEDWNAFDRSTFMYAVYVVGLGLVAIGMQNAGMI